MKTNGEIRGEGVKVVCGILLLLNFIFAAGTGAMNLHSFTGCGTWGQKWSKTGLKRAKVTVVDICFLVVVVCLVKKMGYGGGPAPVIEELMSRGGD